MSASQTESSHELVSRARGGDAEAVGRLFERYFPRLCQWASGRLPRWAREFVDTQDLVQEAIVESTRRLPTFEFRGSGALYAYLRQALQNRIRNEVRRVSRRPTTGEFVGDEPDLGPSPLEEMVGRETLDRYESALARLKESDREAIVLRIEMDCTYEEVAEALAKPSTDAARVAVARALVRLSEEMSRG